jgi:hypothetical protein
MPPQNPRGAPSSTECRRLTSQEGPLEIPGYGAVPGYIPIAVAPALAVHPRSPMVGPSSNSDDFENGGSLAVPL